MDERQCLQVIIGATEDGKKELVAIDGGFRERDLYWVQLLTGLKSRKMKPSAYFMRVCEVKYPKGE